MAESIILDLGASIKGSSEMKDAKYKDKLVLFSVQWSAMHPLVDAPSNKQRSSGDPHLSEISCTKAWDLATCDIIKTCLIGDALDKATLYFFRMQDSEPKPYITITLMEPMIGNYSVSSGGEVPTETFTLNFTAIQIDYVQQGTAAADAGTATMSWDRKIAAQKK
jgi:type VI secretion system secreted protein Hcp